MFQRFEGHSTAIGVLGAMIVIGAVSAPVAIAASTPLAACQTISSPGSYIVTQDINATGNCFVLTSDGTGAGAPTNSVGIDLGKHTITGDGTGSAAR